MKKVFVVVMMLGILTACEHKPEVVTLEGDLYFLTIDHQKMYASKDAILTKIESEVKTVDRAKLDKQTKQVFEYLEFLVDNELLRKPYVRVRLDNEKVKMLYLDTVAYKQFEQYNWDTLLAENKKIRIKAEAMEMIYDTTTAYNTIKLIAVDKIDGETFGKR